MDGYRLLILSILVLALGPVAHHLARSAGWMLALLEGFVLAAIGGLVLIHVLPHSLHEAGWLAVVAAFVGFLAPSVVEQRLHRYAAQAHSVALLVATAGIAIHAFADGLALAQGVGTGPGREHSMLPAAVVLHRLPVGATIWVLLRPQYGQRLALSTLAILAGSTVLGYELGEAAIAGSSDRTWGLFQALVAGSLIHVLIHRSPVAVPGMWAGPILAGGGGGILLVGLISWHEKEALGSLELVGYPICAVLFVLYALGRASPRFRRLFGHQHAHDGDDDHAHEHH